MSDAARQITERLLRNAALLTFTDNQAHSLHRWGGLPAVNESQPWPVCPNCSNPQAFLAQVDTGRIPFPVHFERPLVCCFVCLGCVGTWWDTEGPLGFSVLRFFGSGDQHLRGDLNLGTLPERTIAMTPACSLPSWGCLDFYSSELSDLSCTADADEPWGLYQALCEELSSVSTYDTQVGGYAAFFEDIAAPTCAECSQEMFLALQVYSEDVDLLSALGAGSLYYFACKEHPDSSALRYQCE